MKYFKDNQSNVYAYESDGSQDAHITDGMVKITEAEMLKLTSPPPLTQEQQTEQVNQQRKRAYTDPLTGSDPLFSEAHRMQLMGETGWEVVRDKAVARYKEIQEELPWPTE